MGGVDLLQTSTEGSIPVYVITNRSIDDQASGLQQFGPRVNDRGPHELRAAEVTRRGRGWEVEILDDELLPSEAKKLIEQHRLPLDPAETHYASLKVACSVADEATKKKSHILFFVHGYNNDMADVLESAHDIEKRYGVIVIPFSWPANGGGIGGTVSYKSDKRDARASAGALERTLQIVHEYFRRITEARRAELLEQATAKHPDNPTARNELYGKLLDKDCPFTVNAMFHSMGNYVLKQSLKSSLSQANHLTFDNIVLVAADTNNLDHGLWVDRLSFRKRCFITINENDYALGASRAKSGSEQLARLGHYLRKLTASSAHYINFTDAAWVRNSHSYFGEPSKRNGDVFDFFKRAFTGEAAEDGLRFHAEGNWYGV